MTRTLRPCGKNWTDATNKEAEEWLERTAKTRGVLDSPKWLDMQRYLKEFLKVQAIYSEKQIDEFRGEGQRGSER